MIAVDTNILVHAHREESPWHKPAVASVRELAEGKAAWAIPWPCIHELLSKLTHPRIFAPPSDPGSALAFVDELLKSPSLVLLSEEEGYWPRLQKLLRDAHVVGPMVHDARIAALCMANGVDELWTADRDFGRFPRLRTKNPLVS